MFIYADETGHTGRHIFQVPRFYRIGALLSEVDVETPLQELIRPRLGELGLSRLHGHEIGASRVAGILDDIMSLLESLGRWKFFIGTIEKDYIATTKFVDTIFDSGENQAVPPLWYNHRLLRHGLCHAADRALKGHNDRRFWDAYLADDIAGIGAVVRSVDNFFRMRETDPRLRQIVRDACRYALLHPEDFTLSASAGRRAYQGHTPNLIAFSMVFDAIYRFHQETGAKPIALIHDRQQEFRTSLKEWADLFGGLRREYDGHFPSMGFAGYDLPKLSMPSSHDVFALQAVDLLLWSVTRNDEVLQPAKARLEVHVDEFGISREVTMAFVSELGALGATPLDEVPMGRAMDLRDQWETDRLRRVRDRRFGEGS